MVDPPQSTMQLKVQRKIQQNITKYINLKSIHCNSTALPPNTLLWQTMLGWWCCQVVVVVLVDTIQCLVLQLVTILCHNTYIVFLNSVLQTGQHYCSEFELRLEFRIVLHVVL